MKIRFKSNNEYVIESNSALLCKYAIGELYGLIDTVVVVDKKNISYLTHINESRAMKHFLELSEISPSYEIAVREDFEPTLFDEIDPRQNQRLYRLLRFDRKGEFIGVF